MGKDARHWPDNYTEALRRYLDHGLSGSQISAEMEREFGAIFTRNAVIGRIYRLGLTRKRLNPIVRKKRKGTAKPKIATSKPSRPHVRGIETNGIPTWEVQADPIELLSADVDPLNLPLTELAPNGCRWPYGGGPYVFCGHQCVEGHSYCAPHMRLSWRGDEGWERPDQVFRAKKFLQPALYVIARSMDSEELGAS